MSYLDLGDAVVIVPGGITAVRSSLLGAVTAGDWDLARQGFGDEDLASE